MVFVGSYYNIFIKLKFRCTNLDDSYSYEMKFDKILYYQIKITLHTKLLIAININMSNKFYLYIY